MPWRSGISEASSRRGLTITLSLTIAAGSVALKSFLPLVVCATALFIGIYQWVRNNRKDQSSDILTRLDELEGQISQLQEQYHLLEFRHNHFVRYVEANMAIRHW